MICAFGANLMTTSYGMAVASSGFLIPQLENPDIGFGISVEEGSWLCKLQTWIFSILGNTEKTNLAAK
jgi:hypothetical protein